MTDLVLNYNIHHHPFQIPSIFIFFKRSILFLFPSFFLFFFLLFKFKLFSSALFFCLKFLLKPQKNKKNLHSRNQFINNILHCTVKGHIM
uniref:Candidate secreted effector n=1 Tax=Meloidogyne incognita TaxID=6306 RepID=A0A914KMJ0_MELIC